VGPRAGLNVLHKKKTFSRWDFDCAVLAAERVEIMQNCSSKI